MSEPLDSEMHQRVAALLAWMQVPLATPDGTPDEKRLWAFNAAQVVTLSQHAIDNAKDAVLHARSEHPAMRNAAVSNAEAVANLDGSQSLCPYPQDDPLCAVWIAAWVARCQWLQANVAAVQ